MATIVDCTADDGSIVYVNLDNVNAFHSRGDKVGTGSAPPERPQAFVIRPLTTSAERGRADLMPTGLRALAFSSLRKKLERCQPDPPCSTVTGNCVLSTREACNATAQDPYV
jgi:hypothetical protein